MSNDSDALLAAPPAGGSASRIVEPCVASSCLREWAESQSEYDGALTSHQWNYGLAALTKRPAPPPEHLEQGDGSRRICIDEEEWTLFQQAKSFIEARKPVGSERGGADARGAERRA